jgi:hypothetical protein
MSLPTLVTLMVGGCGNTLKYFVVGKWHYYIEKKICNHTCRGFDSVTVIGLFDVGQCVCLR